MSNNREEELRNIRLAIKDLFDRVQTISRTDSLREEIEKIDNYIREGKNRCCLCHHFDEILTGDGASTGTGYCRRYPPTVNPDADPAQYPVVVSVDIGCGEYECLYDNKDDEEYVDEQPF